MGLPGSPKIPALGKWNWPGRIVRTKRPSGWGQISHGPRSSNTSARRNMPDAASSSKAALARAWSASSNTADTRIWISGDAGVTARWGRMRNVSWATPVGHEHTAAASAMSTRWVMLLIMIESGPARNSIFCQSTPGVQARLPRLPGLALWASLRTTIRCSPAGRGRRWRAGGGDSGVGDLLITAQESQTELRSLSSSGLFHGMVVELRARDEFAISDFDGRDLRQRFIR